MPAVGGRCVIATALLGREEEPLLLPLLLAVVGLTVLAGGWCGGGGACGGAGDVGGRDVEPWLLVPLTLLFADCGLEGMLAMAGGRRPVLLGRPLGGRLLGGRGVDEVLLLLLLPTLLPVRGRLGGGPVLLALRVPPMAVVPAVPPRAESTEPPAREALAMAACSGKRR